MIRILDEDKIKILENVSIFLRDLPGEFDELLEYAQRGRPDLYKRRVNLLMIGFRASAVALRVVQDRMVSKDE